MTIDSHRPGDPVTATDEPIHRTAPRPAIAGLLAFLSTPIGMLYVRRPAWALGYLLVGQVLTMLMVAAVYSELGPTLPSRAYLMPVLTFKIVCAIHAFVLGSHAASLGNPWYTRWYSLAGAALSLIAAVFLLRAFVFETFSGNSANMYPTIRPGAVLFVSKLGHGNYGAYGLQLPEMAHSKQIERTDVVVYRRPDNPQLVVVGRIIGLPGDHIQYVDRQLSINGVEVPTSSGPPDDLYAGIAYHYVTEVINGRRIAIAWIPARVARDANEVVPPGNFMLLGDSRDNAKDSRYIGMIPRANILGSSATSSPQLQQALASHVQRRPVRIADQRCGGLCMSELFAWLDIPALVLWGTALSRGEVLGFLTGVACVWLAARNHIGNFPLGVANSLLLLQLFLRTRLFADAALQLFFIALNLRGWWQWARHGAAPVLPITSASRSQLATAAVWSIAGIPTLTLVLTLARGSVPLFDASITALSLVAQWLMNRRLLQSWWWWMVVDVISIPVYVYKGCT